MGLKETSKFISLILRHRPETIGISLDEHGWADVQELIRGINSAGRHHLDRELLEEIVRTDEKQRYSFNEDHTLIRANQGHSIPVDVELEEKTPPAVLYHGTGEKYTASIDEQGLLPRGRLYVHLSSDPETAKKVGSRHGRPVIYTVDCAAMTADGYAFFLSANKVWLTKKVPVKYLRKAALHGGRCGMDYEEVFQKKNIDLVFDRTARRGNFIAAAYDEFTEFMDLGEFGREWAWSFPAGRYVITVYQRHSLYEAGKQVWKNDQFLNTVGKDSRYRNPSFVIILDRAQEYWPRTWKRSLLSHTVQSSGDPLQAEMFSSAEDAGKAAVKFSVQGFKAAVMEWYEDYDMY